MRVTRKAKGSFPKPTFAAERCYKCKEAIVGVRKCRCTDGRMPRKAWINGILRPINGCDTCGSTLHSACSKTTEVAK